ncbi:HIT family protein [Frankia sp. Cas3]|uniref:HIT family protein n=1 Tax=Frankia sp. Cas3 TaxID=3073926 RepID=UPI002AD32E45|nr:HIT family protein [Frankia sp. Cas3]
MVGALDDCYSCVGNGSLDTLPPRERILLGSGWRVAHAIRAALPGWLVVVARRHVTSLGDLTAAEASELGLMTWRLGRALADVTGCAKTYVAAFSEAPGFTHIHVHVIPRAESLPTADRGPAVFSYLRRPASEWVSSEVMDSLAETLAVSLASMP